MSRRRRWRGQEAQLAVALLLVRTGGNEAVQVNIEAEVAAERCTTVTTPACKDATDARPCCCFTLRRMSGITARASRPAMAASSSAS